jgi:hypothetical protein
MVVLMFAVAGDELGDVRRHAVGDGVGDEQPSEVVEGVAHQLAGRVFDADLGQRVVKVVAEHALADRRWSSRRRHWNSSGMGGL